MKDRLTPKLREIWQEVDHYYKSNPLINLPFATAAWSFLVFAEDRMLAAQVDIVEIQPLSNENMNPKWIVQPRQLTSQDIAMIGDNLVNELKDPMRWLYHACESGGRVPLAHNEDYYKASGDLFELGQAYRWFAFAYTYFRHGRIGLELQESTIQPTEDFFTNIEYNAYNRLLKPHKLQEVLSSVNSNSLHLLEDAIKHSLKIKGDRFSYKLNPRMVSDTIEAFIKPRLDIIFSLPSEWQFGCYTLEDFHKVFGAISAIAYIHATARRMAADRRCIGMGNIDSIYLPSCGELLRRVVRYSGVSESKVRSIFDDLSYGSRGISNPDPALQPLIKMNSEVYAIMPHLWLYCSSERNLTVLLNKLLPERQIYSKLVSKKETLMRERFTTCLSGKGFRFISGRVLGLPPDVDLAIIKDSEKSCLLLELKWFIGPEEALEVIGRSKMIKKGISQVLKLKQALKWTLCRGQNAVKISKIIESS